MIRFGIVGAGNIAHKFARDIAAVDNATITAVASRSLDKANAFATEHDIPHAMEGYEALAKSDHIDAVYVATPHNYHKDHSILCLSHGKHVLCEKPIAVNATELREMMTVAKQHNVLLMEAMWTRFLPAMRALDGILQSGELGTLKHLDVRFGFPLTDHATQDGRLLNPALAGGSLLDLGVYCITMFRMVSDDSIRSLTTSALMSNTGVDLMTVADMVLDNPERSRVHLECAQDRMLSNVAILTFENGVIEIPNFWSTQSLIINGNEEPFPHKIGGFEYEIEHFVATLDAGGTDNPIMTVATSLDVMTLMDDIRSSIGLRFPFE